MLYWKMVPFSSLFVHLISFIKDKHLFAQILVLFNLFIYIYIIHFYKKNTICKSTSGVVDELWVPYSRWLKIRIFMQTAVTVRIPLQHVARYLTVRNIVQCCWLPVLVQVSCTGTSIGLAPLVFRSTSTGMVRTCTSTKSYRTRTVRQYITRSPVQVIR